MTGVVLHRDRSVTLGGVPVGTWKSMVWGFAFNCSCGARVENMYQQYLRIQATNHLSVPIAEHVLAEPTR